MFTIRVNGVEHTVDASEDKPLLWVCLLYTSDAADE